MLHVFHVNRSYHLNICVKNSDKPVWYLITYPLWIIKITKGMKINHRSWIKFPFGKYIQTTIHVIMYFQVSVLLWNTLIAHEFTPIPCIEISFMAVDYGASCQIQRSRVRWIFNLERVFHILSPARIATTKTRRFPQVSCIIYYTFTYTCMLFTRWK